MKLCIHNYLIIQIRQLGIKSYLFNKYSKIIYAQFQFSIIFQSSIIYIMKITKGITLLVVILCLVLAQQESQMQYMTVGDSITGFASQQFDFLSFELLRVNEIEGQYLVLTVAPLDEENFDKIKISVFKTGDDKILFQCEAKGMDACLISRQLLLNNTDYVIEITCVEFCQYAFKSYWENVRKLSPNDGFNFYLNKGGKAQIYHLALQNQKYEEIRIMLTPKSKKLFGDQIKMYGVYGQKEVPTEQHYQFKSISLWGGGEGIFLSSSEVKNRNLTILLLGQSQTVYSLTSQMISSTHHTIKQDEKEIIQLSSGKDEKIKFILNQSTQGDEYVFSFSLMNGEAKIMTYWDQNFTTVANLWNFNYMNDFQFLISQQRVAEQKSKALYVKVQCDEKDTVFMVKYYKRTSTSAIQMTESIYEFITLQKQRLAYIYFDAFRFYQDDNPHNDSSQINVNIMRVKGTYDISFRICTTNAFKCIKPKEYKEYSKPIEVKNMGEIGIKVHYKIKIQDSELIDINSIEKRGIVLIQIKSNDEEEMGLVTAQYSFGDKIQHLRLNHPLQQIMQTGEQKIFKYVNTDTAIQSVRFHVNQIRGNVKAKVYHQNPLQKHNENLTTDSIRKVKTTKLYEPLYLVISAQKTSIVGISIQELHNNNVPTPMTLSENIPYHLRIGPEKEQIIKLNPIYSNLTLSFLSTGTVMICPINPANHQCTQKLPILARQGKLVLQKTIKEELVILLKNPNPNKFIELRVSYISLQFFHCQNVQIGHIYNPSVVNGNCFQFLLEKIDDDLLFYFERTDIGPMKIQAQICGYNLQKSLSPHQIIDKKDLTKYCNQTSTANRKMTIIINTIDNKEENFKLLIGTSYRNSQLQLSDGLSYRHKGLSSENAVKIFFYKAINLLNTKIILQTFVGNLQVYAKIVEASERNLVDVNIRNYDIQLEGNSYLNTVTSVINKQKLEQHPCSICGILVAIYSKDSIGTQVDFSIEIVQNHRVLKDNTMSSNLLSKGSFAFYEYTSTKSTNCNMIVETSDNNKRCTKIMLSKNQVPTQSNAIAIQNGNKLVYSNCTAQTYYIGIQAVDECQYSIEVTNSFQSIVKIQRGKPVNLKLKDKETKYVLFRHISPNYFKLVTMNQFGLAQIYATTFNPQLVQSLREGQKLDLNEFKFKSYVRNSLLVKPTDKDFCSDCYYVAAVRAFMDLQSTLILVDRQSSVQLNTKKVLSDQLQLGNITYISFVNIFTGQLPLLVFKGTVKVKIEYGKQIFSKQFEQNKDVQSFNYEINESNTLSRNPIMVQIQCTTPYCYYSIGLIDNTQKRNTYHQLIKGLPTYLLVSESQDNCLSGFLQNKDTNIILSGKQLAQKSQNIRFSLKVQNEVDENINVQSYGNMVVVKTSLQINQSLNFELCLDTNQSSLLVIAQMGQNVKVLQENEYQLASQNSTFIIYPDGPFLFDLFKCAGQPSFKYSTDQNLLSKNDGMKPYSQVSMPEQPHAMKIQSFLPTFLRLQGQASIVKWMPFNEITEQGVGYQKYGTGAIRYHTQGDNLFIQWGSLFRKYMTETKVSSEKYTIFLSSSQKVVQKISQCNSDDQNSLSYDIVPESFMQKGTNLNITISKSQLEQKFGKYSNVFMVIVAQVLIKTPSKQQVNAAEGQVEQYKFIYPQQEIPTDIYKGDYSSEYKLNPIIIVIIGFSISSVAVLLILYIILKKFIPVLSRLKNRMLLEEHNQQPSSAPHMVTNERIVVDDT